MSTHLVLGAGEIGRPLALRLIGSGDEVRVGTRSGTAVDGAQAVKLDASDPDALSAAAEGAATIFLCTNPPYQDWPQAWPPIFAAVIEAARRSGAALVAMGNLYPYGSVTTPMTEHSPETTAERKGLVRKAGWAAMREASEGGTIRAVEVRASDYFGPGAGPTAQLGERFFSPDRAARRRWRRPSTSVARAMTGPRTAMRSMNGEPVTANSTPATTTGAVVATMGNPGFCGSGSTRGAGTRTTGGSIIPTASAVASAHPLPRRLDADRRVSESRWRTLGASPRACLPIPCAGEDVP